MVGTLFKYGTGTGGAEYYITGYTDTQNVTVDTSALVTMPAVGVVWYVNQTGLQTYLHAATSYQTNAGDNSTTISGGQVTFQRTFIVPTQLAPYSVNEIGWNGKSLGDSTNTVNGRIVLGSTDVVGITNYYVVIVQIIFNYTPAAPAAVLNVGTAINTAGTAMIESLGSIQQVASNGTVTGSNLCLDGSAQVGLTGSSGHIHTKLNPVANNAARHSHATRRLPGRGQLDRHGRSRHHDRDAQFFLHHRRTDPLRHCLAKLYSRRRFDF